MKFIDTGLASSFLVEPEVLADSRGFFARTFCRNEFLERGLNATVAQCNISFNGQRGTLRGMHFQASPCSEVKLVRCTQGGIYDVIVDIRPDSPTFGEWFGCELTSENRLMIYVPEGFAHGFQTLTSNTEVFYQMSEFYDATAARGVRWNDTNFSIEWPIENPIMSERDKKFEDFVL